MLRIRDKDVPQFKINNFELICEGGTPGTWVDSEKINVYNSFTNKTQYNGTIYRTDTQGHTWEQSFEPNGLVTVGYNNTAHIIMHGGENPSLVCTPLDEEGRDQK